MGYVFDHQVRFHETDGAGVVYFANELVICHTAYEASLEAAGLDIGQFFQGEGVAHPIVHASIDYRRPLRCGDHLVVHLTPTRVDESSYEIQYQLKLEDVLAAQALTRHICIEVGSRRRAPLSTQVEQWLERWGAPSAEES